MCRIIWLRMPDLHEVLTCEAAGGDGINGCGATHPAGVGVANGVRVGHPKLMTQLGSLAWKVRVFQPTQTPDCSRPALQAPLTHPSGDPLRNEPTKLTAIGRKVKSESNLAPSAN